METIASLKNLDENLSACADQSSWFHTVCTFCSLIDSSLAQAYFIISLLTQTCMMVQCNNYSESIIVFLPSCLSVLFLKPPFQLSWTGFLSLLLKQATTGFITVTGLSAGVLAHLCRYNWTRVQSSWHELYKNW